MNSRLNVKKRKSLRKRIHDIDIPRAFRNQKVRTAGAVAGIVILGIAALAPVDANAKQSMAKDPSANVLRTAGVATQLMQAEQTWRGYPMQNDIVLSRKTDLNMTGAGYLSLDPVTTEAVTADAISDSAKEAVPQEDATAQAVSAQAVSDAATEAEVPAQTEPARPNLPEFSNPGIARVEQFVNIRTAPDTSSQICGKLSNNAACEILSEENGWYQVVTNGIQGYVKAEYLVTGEEAWQLADQLKIAYVKVQADTLNIRQEPSMESAVIGQAGSGQKLTMVEEQEQWVKVSVDNKEGYVCKDYVAIEYTLPKGEAVEKKEPVVEAVTYVVEESAEPENYVAPAELESVPQESEVQEVVEEQSPEPAPAPDCSSVVAYATSFVGNPYVYGGSSLTNGTDCSGFTMRVYEQFGVSLPHSSSAQASCGVAVSTDDMQPGDLVFYGSGGGINHVAIYIGGGQIVHASTKKTGIKISNAFYSTPLAVRRVK